MFVIILFLGIKKELSIDYRKLFNNFFETFSNYYFLPKNSFAADGSGVIESSPGVQLAGHT